MLQMWFDETEQASEIDMARILELPYAEFNNYDEDAKCSNG